MADRDSQGLAHLYYCRRRSKVIELLTDDERKKTGKGSFNRREPEHRGRPNVMITV